MTTGKPRTVNHARAVRRLVVRRHRRRPPSATRAWATGWAAN